MIFGSGSAQMQQGTGSIVVLQHSNIVPEYIITDEKEHKSVLTGHKTFTTLGDYSKFRIDINLYKYDNPTTTFQTLYPYIHNNVYFWPHSDGKAISGSNNLPVEFHITDMKLSYLGDHLYRDLLSIEFEAVDYTDISKGL